MLYWAGFLDGTGRLARRRLLNLHRRRCPAAKQLAHDDFDSSDELDEKMLLKLQESATASDFQSPGMKTRLQPGLPGALRGP